MLATLVRISRVLGWIDTLVLGDFSCFAKTRVDKPRVIEDVDRRTVMTTKLFDSSVISEAQKDFMAKILEVPRNIPPFEHLDGHICCGTEAKQQHRTSESQ
jgi:hypothetical protein